MKRHIDVIFGEPTREVGTLRFEARGSKQSAGFEYRSSWLEGSSRFALEPGLQLVSGVQFFPRASDGSPFQGAIADSEPDGWGRKVILRDHMKRREATRRAGAGTESRPLDHLDYLLAVDDACRVGALRFRDERGIFQRAAEPGKRTTPPLVELALLLGATRAVETQSETDADLAYLLGRGTSVGGLRPKCSVLDEDDHLSIGKFPSVTDDRAVTKGEVLALEVAREAGVDAAEARLVFAGGSPVALIRRFDRTRDGSRIHYISAATLLGVVDLDSQHTYTEIVDALRQHGARPQLDIEELFRRIALSVLITNVDDHLKNHGFLHEELGRFRLAPAFDVNPFPERQRELKTWISEETGPESSIEALLSVAPYFRVSREKARRIIGEVERAVARWQSIGSALGMTASELDAFAPAFEHGERRAAAALA